MTIVDVGKLVRRAALVASIASLSACAPSSISAPQRMRPLTPQGPALAGRHLGSSAADHVTSPPTALDPDAPGTVPEGGL